jgi:hypothetical protein
MVSRFPCSPCCPQGPDVIGAEEALPGPGRPWPDPRDPHGTDPPEGRDPADRGDLGVQRRRNVPGAPGRRRRGIQAAGSRRSGPRGPARARLARREQRRGLAAEPGRRSPWRAAQPSSDACRRGARSATRTSAVAPAGPPDRACSSRPVQPRARVPPGAGPAGRTMRVAATPSTASARAHANLAVLAATVGTLSSLTNLLPGTRARGTVSSSDRVCHCPAAARMRPATATLTGRDHADRSRATTLCWGGEARIDEL